MLQSLKGKNKIENLIKLYIVQGLQNVHCCTELYFFIKPQIWILPEEHGKKADYKLNEVGDDKLTKIYGSKKNQSTTFDSYTVLEVGRF